MSVYYEAVQSCAGGMAVTDLLAWIACVAGFCFLMWLMARD